MPLVYLYKCNVLFRYLNMREWGTEMSVLHYSFPPNIHIMSDLTWIPRLAVSTNPVSVFHVSFQLHNIFKASAWFSHGCLSERQGACFSQCVFSLVWHATIECQNSQATICHVLHITGLVMYFLFMSSWCGILRSLTRSLRSLCPLKLYGCPISSVNCKNWYYVFLFKFHNMSLDYSIHSVSSQKCSTFVLLF